MQYLTKKQIINIIDEAVSYADASYADGSKLSIKTMNEILRRAEAGVTLEAEDLEEKT